jgi:hypothetical protein
MASDSISLREIRFAKFYFLQCVDHMRKGARRMVREMKQRTSKRAKKWVLTWDETEIDRFADEDRIQEVLDMIGREDQLSKLRNAAYAEVGQPTPPKQSQSAADSQWALEETPRQFGKLKKRKKVYLTKLTDFK